MEYEDYLKETSIVGSTSNTEIAGLAYEGHLSEYADFSEKSRFFSQVFVNEDQKLLAVINDHDSRTDLVYRGVNQARFKLYNSLQRAVIPHKNQYPMPYKQIWKNLIDAAVTAKGGLLRKYFAHQGMELVTDLAWLAYLQHFGCPTPLLDWTYDFRKALYFAADGATDQAASDDIGCYVSVYAVHDALACALSPKGDIEAIFSPLGEQSRLEDGLLAEVMRPVRSVYGDDVVDSARDELRRRRRVRYFRSRLHKIFDLDLLAATRAVFVSDRDAYTDLSLRLENNLNIIAQDGAFFFNSHPFAPLEWVLEGDVEFSGANPEHDNCYSINIHKSMLPTVRALLAERGYSRATIFPDPYEICATIARDVL